MVVLAVSGLLGIGFLLVMPRKERRTPRSDAEELGILFCLMTVASPLARQYYFIWLFFPITVLMHRATFDPRPRVRLWTWLALAFSGILMLLSLPPFPKDLQAWGNNFAATAVMAGALVWHILHPLADKDAGSLPAAEVEAAK
jgi:drug/metabolite transporter (DMT)-like permease